VNAIKQNVVDQYLPFKVVQQKGEKERPNTDKRTFTETYKTHQSAIRESETARNDEGRISRKEKDMKGTEKESVKQTKPNGEDEDSEEQESVSEETKTDSDEALLAIPEILAWLKTDQISIPEELKALLFNGLATQTEESEEGMKLLKASLSVWLKLQEGKEETLSQTEFDAKIDSLFTVAETFSGGTQTDGSEKKDIIEDISYLGKSVEEALPLTLGEPISEPDSMGISEIFKEVRQGENTQSSDLIPEETSEQSNGKNEVSTEPEKVIVTSQRKENINTVVSEEKVVVSGMSASLEENKAIVRETMSVTENNPENAKVIAGTGTEQKSLLSSDREIQENDAVSNNTKLVENTDTIEESFPQNSDEVVSSFTNTVGPRVSLSAEEIKDSDDTIGVVKPFETDLSGKTVFLKGTTEKPVETDHSLLSDGIRIAMPEAVDSQTIQIKGNLKSSANIGKTVQIVDKTEKDSTISQEAWEKYRDVFFSKDVQKVKLEAFTIKSFQKNVQTADTSFNASKSIEKSEGIQISENTKGIDNVSFRMYTPVKSNIYSDLGNARLRDIQSETVSPLEKSMVSNKESPSVTDTKPSILVSETDTFVVDTVTRTSAKEQDTNGEQEQMDGFQQKITQTQEVLSATGDFKGIDTDMESTMQEIIQKIKDLTLLSSQQTRTIETAVLRLDPPELGKMVLEVVKEGNTVSVMMKVETQEAKEMIEKNVHLLTQKLAQAGFETQKVQVSMEKYEEQGKEHESPDQNNTSDQNKHKQGQQKQEEKNTRTSMFRSFSELLTGIEAYSEV
jgi:flagellar hook-length control protein FliK